MRKIFAFMFMFLFMITLVSAIPPVLQANDGIEGISIEVLAPITIPPSTAVMVHVHTFNSSNGLLLTNATGVSCEGLLINNRGVTIAEQTATISGDHFKFGLNTTMASTVGNYHYTLHCNDSSIGGYHTGYFQVTYNGLELPEGITIIFFALFAVFSFLMMLYTMYLILLDFVQVETNFKTVFIGLGAYIITLGNYYFLSEYLALPLLTDLSLWGVEIFGFTHMFLPLIGLVIAFIKNGGWDFGR